MTTTLVHSVSDNSFSPTQIETAPVDKMIIELNKLISKAAQSIFLSEGYIAFKKQQLKISFLGELIGDARIPYDRILIKLKKVGSGTEKEVYAIAQLYLSRGYRCCQVEQKSNFAFLVSLNSSKEIQFLNSHGGRNGVVPLIDSTTIQVGRIAKTLMIEPLYESDLGTYLENHALSIENTKLMLKQVKEAYRYLTEIGYVVPDAKPANCLVREGELRIADLGSCCRVQTETPSKEFSPIFVAPEIVYYNLVRQMKVEKENALLANESYPYLEEIFSIIPKSSTTQDYLLAINGWSAFVIAWAIIQKLEKGESFSQKGSLLFPWGKNLALLNRFSLPKHYPNNRTSVDRIPTIARLVQQDIAVLKLPHTTDNELQNMYTMFQELVTDAPDQRVRSSFFNDLTLNRPEIRKERSPTKISPKKIKHMKYEKLDQSTIPTFGSDQSTIIDSNQNENTVPFIE